jgi:DNA segregation ATPase FtsK/SpoIIIE-like protein
MGFSDDDYTDDDVYYDDDDDVNDVYDDDEEVSTSRSTSNPFSRPGGSGLPGSSRSSSSFGSGSSGGASDKPSSPFRSGGSSSGGSSSSSDRPSSPFGRSSGGSSGGSSFGSSRDRDDKKSDSRRFGGGSGSSSGGSFGSSRDRDDKKSDSGGRSFGSGSSSSSSSPFSGSRDRDDKKSDSRRFGSGGSGGSSGGSSFGSSRDRDDKKDDKKSGSGLGSRFGLGGGDKKDDAKKSGAGGGLLGGLGGLGRGGKGDKKPSAGKGGTGSGVGGMLSGVSGLFSRGGGDKKGDAKKSGSGGGLFGGLGRGGKDDKSSTASRRPDSGGAFGGSRDQTGSAGQRSPFGSRQTGGEAGGGRGTFGGGKQEGGRQAKAEGGGFLSRINIFGGGGAAKSQQRTSKTRAAKVPKTAEGGFQLDLDAKLDILGVVFFFGGMILLISSLSADQGSVTGWFNNIFTSLFGWGAMAGPVTMMAIGVWLMVRHFGDEAPVIDPVRVTGVVLLYLGILMVMMFIETFNELYSTVTTRDVLLLYLDISVEAGRGGGIIGAELYKVLVQNVGEIGAVFSMIGWFVVGIMLATRTSAAEIAVFVISVWRSFQVSLQRRSQRRRAQRLALAEARQAEQAAQISVSRPAAGELGAGISGALPAPEEGSARPIEDRPIAIRMGGQMISANVEAGADQQPQTGARPPSTLPQEESSGGRFGGIAARFRKPFGSSSGDSAQASPAKTETPEEGSGSVGTAVAAAVGTVATLGGLLGSRNGGEGEARSSQQTAQPVSPPQPSALPPTPDRTSQQGLFGRDAEPAANKTGSPFARPATPTSTTTREPGSDPRPGPFQTAAQSATAGAAPNRDASPSTPNASPFGVRPSDPQQPAASTAPERGREAAPEDVRAGNTQSQATRTPFGSPARSSTPPPAPGASRPSAADRFGLRSRTIDEEDEDERGETSKGTEEKSAAELPGTGRLDRLQQIRSGQTNVPSSATPVSADDDEDEEDEEVSATPAASAQNPFASSGLGSVSRPSPFGSLVDEDEDEDEDFDNDLDDEDLDDEDLDIDDEITDDEEEETVAASPAPPWSTTRPEQPRSLGGSTFTPPTTRAGTPARVPEPAPSTSQQPARSPFPSQPAAARSESTAATPTPAPATSPEPVINPPRERPVAPPVRVTGGSQQHWRLPDYRTLLASGSDQEFDREGLVRRARIIEETLQSFGAPGRVVEVNTGPVITQFGVEPDYLTARSGKKSRVKVGAIAQLDKDLQLALGAKSIRIRSPVPGKGYVGIEVPNDEASPSACAM